MLDRGEFDPTERITLHFGGNTVKIIRRNPGAEARPNVRLFDGIICSRV